MWMLYQLATGLVLAVAGPLLLARRGGHYLETLPGRLGRHRGRVERQGLWLHAVSVGEVGVAATLAGALPETLPLLVTTVTPTGQRRARDLFSERGSVAYLPFELGFAVRSFFRRFSPRGLVLIEGELWPLVLRAARRAQIPVVVINGRISDRSYRRLRRARPLLPLLYDGVLRFGMQSDEDRRRLVDLGVASERITVTGNLKYETPAPPPLPELEAWIRALAGGRAILIAGSTMSGEEERVLNAFRRLGPDRALLVLAPRHPERFAAVADEVARQQLTLLHRSTFPAAAVRSSPDVLLLDSLGELASLYRVAACAYVGGTLVPTGGHNPLEPARYGVAVVAGPSMENFREMSAEFDRAAAWLRVDGEDALAAAWQRLLAEPATARELGERAARLIASHRGALRQTLELLGKTMPGLA